MGPKLPEARELSAPCNPIVRPSRGSWSNSAPNPAASPEAVCPGDRAAESKAAKRHMYMIVDIMYDSLKSLLL
jgi:hypothetical protein